MWKSHIMSRSCERVALIVTLQEIKNAHFISDQELYIALVASLP